MSYNADVLQETGTGCHSWPHGFIPSFLMGSVFRIALGLLGVLSLNICMTTSVHLKDKLFNTAAFNWLIDVMHIVRLDFFYQTWQNGIFISCYYVCCAQCCLCLWIEMVYVHQHKQISSIWVGFLEFWKPVCFK